MHMLTAEAHVKFKAGGTGALKCELCTAALTPTVTLVVDHPNGGLVELAACDWCVHAMRRLAAVTGGHMLLALAEAGMLPSESQRAVPSGARPASPPVLVLEFAEQFRDSAEGTGYVVRAYGRARVDGTWEGWLEFESPRAADTLRTGQETTQSSREGVAYWASGLEVTYLAGAFERARRRSP
jgi:hypothetical protein